jgi:hypothetical protein
MSPSEEDVIRVHDVPRTEVQTPARNERLTNVGPGNVKVDGTNAKRTIPTPWVDCEACARRHYPSTLGGRWHVATMCLSCGSPLPGGA